MPLSLREAFAFHVAMTLMLRVIPAEPDIEQTRSIWPGKCGMGLSTRPSSTITMRF